MVTGKRRSYGFLDRTWAVIAVVAGVLIVVAGVLVFLTPGGNTTGLSMPGSTVAPPSPGQGMPVPAAVSPGQPGVLSYRMAPTRDFEPVNVSVPAQGIFIKVMYRGAYAGKYISGNVTQDLDSSGERVFGIEKPGPSVYASVKKLDGSSKQQIMVEIWRNGTQITSNSTYLPFGGVTVSGNI